MALATKCPHCNTIFRVAADQLKLRGGIVRCGSCHEVFDGNAALVEPATKPTPVIPEVPAAGEVTVPGYVQGGAVDFELDFADEVVEPAVWRGAALTRGGQGASAPAAPPSPSPEEIAQAVVARAFAHVTAPHEASVALNASAASASTPAVQPLPWEDGPAHADAPSAVDSQPVPNEPAEQSELASAHSSDDGASSGEGQSDSGDDAAPSGDDVVSPGDATSLTADDTVAAADDTSPSGNDTPHSDDDAPHSDDGVITSADAVPTSGDAVAESGNAVIPSGDDMAASGHDANSSGDDVASSGDGVTSAGDDLPPSSDEVGASGDDAPHLGDDVATSGDDLTAYDDGVAASSDDVTSPVDDLAVSDDNVAAFGDGVAASGNDMAASGNDVTAADGGAPPAGDDVAVSDDKVAASGDGVAASGDAMAASGNDMPTSGDEAAGFDGSETPPGDGEARDEQATALASMAPESDFVPAFLRARPVEERAKADAETDANFPPDGRIEPTFDTPQEHIVAASLDDAHHFEDLPLAEQPAPQPEDAPWSMSAPADGNDHEPERDETALHAVAAVNADVPDDGASLPNDEADEPAEESSSTRRERALERAQERSSDREATAARMRALAGVDEAPNDDLDHSDLSFVKRHDRSQKYGKAIKATMALGIPLLLAGLVLQAATTFRDTLAASYPQLKPALAAVCQPLGCQVGLPTQLDALSIEQGELASMAENTFSFSTVLRNQSKTAQAWPHIELTLNDNADKPVLRRVFVPREYLPPAMEADKGFGPRSEQSVKLYFELKELKASGYHIAIFYP